LRKIQILTALLVTAVAFPVSAQLKPAPLPEIFESYNDCFAATPASGVSTSALEKLGWIRATIESDGTKDTKPDLIIFGHSDRRPLIMLDKESGPGICIVTAKLENKRNFQSFLDAFGGKLPKPDKNGNITYFVNGQVVQLAKTGTRKEPAMRAVIMTPEESK